jgi:hypothetical protein
VKQQIRLFVESIDVMLAVTCDSGNPGYKPVKMLQYITKLNSFYIISLSVLFCGRTDKIKCG